MDYEQALLFKTPTQEIKKNIITQNTVNLGFCVLNISQDHTICQKVYV